MKHFFETFAEKHERDQLARELRQTAVRLVNLIGSGLHLDNSGSDYETLSADQARAFDEDVSEVFSLCEHLELEPYEYVMSIMTELKV